MKPTQPNERYKILDVLRGFALVGVLIANMSSHSGYFFLSPTARETLPNAQAGETLMWIIHFVTDGKFYSIFSLLFGVGFALQLQRAEEKGVPFKGRFSRRLLILFLIGLFHAIFFYVGDILTVYALVGFVLLLFRNVSNKGLIRWSIVLLCLPVFQYAFSWWQAQNNPPVDLSQQYTFFEQVVAAYRTGSLSDILYMNIGGLAFGRYPDLVFTGRFFKVLAMFLLGYFIARKQWYVSISTHKQTLKKIVVWSAIIGIPCNIVLAQMMTTEAYYTYEPTGIIQPIVYAFGVPALGISYACGIALLFQKDRVKRLLTIFAPFGRMALTNYLMQSVICCFIYQSYGFGLYATEGPLAFTMVGFGILIFQIVFSHVWLSKYQFGPMEWLWRSLTYKRWQPLKKPNLDTLKT
ncbi:DUF418 domain-containing protein [Flavobacteriaceae bacterium TK19130]|nr:DUF418 domain-containing protein [Thermobacterium salinum]